MNPREVIKWLRECSKDGSHDCENCPYNKEPYEAGCGKLLSDAALLLQAAYIPLDSPAMDMTAIRRLEVIER